VGIKAVFCGEDYDESVDKAGGADSYDLLCLANISAYVSFCRTPIGACAPLGSFSRSACRIDFRRVDPHCCPAFPGTSVWCNPKRREIIILHTATAGQDVSDINSPNHY